MPNTSRLRAQWMLPVFGITMLLSAACGGDDDGPIDPPQSDGRIDIRY